MAREIFFALSDLLWEQIHITNLIHYYDSIFILISQRNNVLLSQPGKDQEFCVRGDENSRGVWRPLAYSIIERNFKALY